MYKNINILNSLKKIFNHIRIVIRKVLNKRYRIFQKEKRLAVVEGLQTNEEHIYLPDTQF